MYLKAFIPVWLFLWGAPQMSAQECTLDIGGKNAETLIKVFQLSTDQIGQMETWSAALALQNKETEEAIQKLFDSHPQSTPEELLQLAEKYKALQQKIVDASWQADKKLLTIFNEKQYERYLQLCMEAVRRPIKVVPTGVRDTIVDPE